MAANIPAQPMVKLHRTDGLMNGTFTVNWRREPERRKPVQLLKRHKQKTNSCLV